MADEPLRLAWADVGDEELAAVARALALPFHSRLTDGDLDRVAAVLRSLL